MQEGDDNLPKKVDTEYFFG